MKIGIVKEMVEFLFKRKKYWLIPLVVILLLIAILVLVGQGSVMPAFIYTLF